MGKIDLSTKEYIFAPYSGRKDCEEPCEITKKTSKGSLFLLKEVFYICLKRQKLIVYSLSLFLILVYKGVAQNSREQMGLCLCLCQ